MIIVLHGENSLFTKRKLDEIIASYKKKHTSGLAFFTFDTQADFLDIKAAWETVSMFEEKKLIVLKNILSEKKSREDVLTYLQEQSAQEDKDRIIVFVELGGLIKKTKENGWLCEKPSIVQESKNPTGSKLSEWILYEAKNNNATIDENAVLFLIQATRGDTWRLANEIAKLAQYNKHITLENTKLLVYYNENAQVFDAVSALAEKDIVKATQAFSHILKEQDWAGILGLIIYQFRAIIKAKILIDENSPLGTIEKEMGMHPYALRKTLGYAKKFTKAHAELLFTSLCDMDIALKTGRTTFDSSLENFTLRVIGLVTK